MKFRIGVWALVGCLVAGGWFLYASARVTPITSAEPIVWTLTRLTQPIIFASFYFHFGVLFYWVLLANTATYALIGLLVEVLRRKLHFTGWFRTDPQSSSL
jgi:hypothetical protein